VVELDPALPTLEKGLVVLLGFPQAKFLFADGQNHPSLVVRLFDLTIEVEEKEKSEKQPMLSS